jgi:putative transposase
MGSPSRRELFLEIFEEVRQQFQFRVIGYVVMPEHVHLLISEPELGDPSGVVQLLKQRTAQRILKSIRGAEKPATEQHVWQRRFYDFNVFTGKKRKEKLLYMHNNPVERGLVESSIGWKWSSARYYRLGEIGPVALNEF